MPPHLPIPYIFPYTTLFRSDQLSQSGVRFQNHYVCTPASSPSRATLFTGRVPRQHGIQDFLTGEPIENPPQGQDRKSTRLNSSHITISYAVFCLKKKTI